MKKTTYRNQPAQKAKKITVEKIVCDLCGKKAGHKCSICKRDLCSDHATCLDYDDRCDSDYPSKYCKPCHKIKFQGENNDLYHEMQARHEKEETKLELKIKKDCLDAAGKGTEDEEGL